MRRLLLILGTGHRHLRVGNAIAAIDAFDYVLASGIKDSYRDRAVLLRTRALRLSGQIDLATEYLDSQGDDLLVSKIEQELNWVKNQVRNFRVEPVVTMLKQCTLLHREWTASRCCLLAY